MAKPLYNAQHFCYLFIITIDASVRAADIDIYYPTSSQTNAFDSGERVGLYQGPRPEKLQN
jgi:hypothetical protein